MATAYNPTTNPFNASINPVSTGTGATDFGTGFEGITNAFAGKIGSATTDLNSALASADFTNPGTLLQMQQKMGTYQVGLGVLSAMIKSFEETLKGITQKM